MQARPRNVAMYAARQQLGLTQAQLAAKVGVVSTTIANIEQGRREPSLRLATKLAATLGLHECDFLLAAAVGGKVAAE